MNYKTTLASFIIVSLCFFGLYAIQFNFEKKNEKVISLEYEKESLSDQVTDLTNLLYSCQSELDYFEKTSSYCK